MKRLPLVFCCALFLGTVGSLPAFSAQGPNGAGSDQKHHWFSFSFHHRQKHPKEKGAPLYTTPKSVGWWHRRSPGPAGAGVK